MFSGPFQFTHPIIILLQAIPRSPMYAQERGLGKV